MKIIVVCTQLEGGGAQRASYKLTGELSRRGIETENWFLYKKRDNFSGLGKTICFLNRPLSSALDYIKISYLYYKQLRKDKPDAVIAFTHYANILALAIAYLARIPIRVASHRNPSWGDMSKGLMKVDNFLAKMGVYTAITAVSKSTKKSFDYYPDEIYKNIAVINNGLDLLDPQATKSEARAFFELPVDVKLIGTIGRLSRQKNQKTLISAIAKLDNVFLAIVGDGELKEDISAQINSLGLTDRVFIIGEIHYSEIPKFLKTLDIYVMPSLFEGLSNALVEAMSVGLPVISSDVDAQKDVVVSENGTINGILLPAEDEMAWAETINSLLNNPNERMRLGLASRNRSLDFTIEKMADGFLSVVNKKD